MIQEGVALALHTQGFGALSRGVTSQAATAFRTSLAVSRDLDFTEGVAVALEGLAAIAASLGNLDEAALLLGKASKLRDTSGLFRQVLEHYFYQATMELLQSRYDPDRLTAILNEGAELDVQALDAIIGNIAGET